MVQDTQGPEGKILTGNPQITFFKSVYRRHTFFNIETRELPFGQTLKFGTKGQTIEIPKGPNLLHKIYLKTKLPEISLTVGQNEYKAFRWLNWIGHNLIKSAQITIGGKTIDEQDGEWLHLWNELTQKEEKKQAYSEMVGNVPNLTQIQSVFGTEANEQTIKILDSYELFIPLKFWFCRNPGHSLPISSIKDTITIEIETEKLQNLMWGSYQSATNILVGNGIEILGPIKPNLESGTLLVDFIHLSDEEQRKFKLQDHEYLIEVIQDRGDKVVNGSSIQKAINSNYDFKFHHPVKEIIWRVRPRQFIDPNFCQSRGGMQPFNYSDHYDYSGFTGTPEPSCGAGMKGGRTNHNLWHGLPSVMLPFEPNVFEPDFSADDITGSSIWNSSSDPIHIVNQPDNAKKSGFNFISKYFPAQGVVTNSDLYKSRNIENMIGNTAAIQNNTDNLGIWSNPNTNMRLNDRGENPVASAKILFDGQKKIEEQTGFFYNVIQPYQCHTNTPAIGINVYSFALEPENHQPSGTVNFSMISNASLDITFSDRASQRSCDIKVFAVSYNILRIKKGSVDTTFF